MAMPTVLVWIKEEIGDSCYCVHWAFVADLLLSSLLIACGFRWGLLVEQWMLIGQVCKAYCSLRIIKRRWTHWYVIVECDTCYLVLVYVHLGWWVHILWQKQSERVRITSEPIISEHLPQCVSQLDLIKMLVPLQMLRIFIIDKWDWTDDGCGRYRRLLAVIPLLFRLAHLCV